MGKIYMGKNNSTGSKLKLISTIIRVKKTLVRFVSLMVEYEVLYQIFLHDSEFLLCRILY